LAFSLVRYATTPALLHREGIQEVPGSSPVWVDTDNYDRIFMGFLRDLQVNTGVVPTDRQISSHSKSLPAYQYHLNVPFVLRCSCTVFAVQTKPNSVVLVRERTIPTERPPLVGEVVSTFADRGVAWSAQRIPTAVNFGFLDRSCYFSFKPSLNILRTDVTNRHQIEQACVAVRPHSCIRGS
jgi:hypothetical protein